MCAAAEFAGLDGTREVVDGAIPEQRTACLMVKRLLDEKRRASACFSAVGAPSPPPPPDTNIASRAQEIFQQREQMRRGENDRYPKPGTTEYQEWADEDYQALENTKDLIKKLGESQPILKSLLDTAVVELTEQVSSTGGRRLLERQGYTYMMTDSLSDHPLMKTAGINGIRGLTTFTCEALCAAVNEDLNNVTNTAHCNAYGFRRSDPYSRTDQTGTCWLLKNAGACKPEDFGTGAAALPLHIRHPAISFNLPPPRSAELYLRHYDSENTCTEVAPGNDAEACIGLPATRRDTLVLTHSDAAAIAAQ